MTIRTCINARELCKRLDNFMECVENAPPGTYEHEKEIAWLLGEFCDDFITAVRGLGLEAPNCDAIREVESVLYGFIAEANPLAVAAGEGFGQAMSTPARKRVIEQAARNRDFLKLVKNS